MLRHLKRLRLLSCPCLSGPVGAVVEVFSMFLTIEQRPTAGVLGTRAEGLEKAAARVCREAGASGIQHFSTGHECRL